MNEHSEKVNKKEYIQKLVQYFPEKFNKEFGISLNESQIVATKIKIFLSKVSNIKYDLTSVLPFNSPEKIKEYQAMLEIAKNDCLDIIPFEIYPTYKFKLSNGSEVDTSNLLYFMDHDCYITPTIGGNLLYSHQDSKSHYAWVEEVCKIDETNIILYGVETVVLKKLINERQKI